MNYIVVSLFLASLCSMGMVAVGEKLKDSSSRPYGESLSNLILNEQVEVSGVVFKSERGLAISTSQGTYLFKGTSGELFIGKSVRITGVIRGESIFALKIAIKA